MFVFLGFVSYEWVFFPELHSSNKAPDQPKTDSDLVKQPLCREPHLRSPNLTSLLFILQAEALNKRVKQCRAIRQSHFLGFALCPWPPAVPPLLEENPDHLVVLSFQCFKLKVVYRLCVQIVVADFLSTLIRQVVRASLSAGIS